MHNQYIYILCSLYTLFGDDIMPSNKMKKKNASKKTKAPPKKKVSKAALKKKTLPTKKESKTQNYDKWTKKQLIDELKAVMDILKSKDKVLHVEKIVEVPGAPAPTPKVPSGPFEIDVTMISGSSVTLKNPNDVCGFLKGQGLVKEAIAK